MTRWPTSPWLPISVARNRTTPRLLAAASNTWPNSSSPTRSAKLARTPSAGITMPPRVMPEIRCRNRTESSPAGGITQRLLA